MEGFASIYSLDEDGNQTWVANLLEKGVGEVNATLQPGNYMLVFRPKYVTSSEYTKRVNFTIISGQTQILNVLQFK
jgi:hypothetical protein